MHADACGVISESKTTKKGVPESRVQTKVHVRTSKACS